MNDFARSQKALAGARIDQREGGAEASEAKGGIAEGTKAKGAPQEEIQEVIEGSTQDCTYIFVVVLAPNAPESVRAL
jgi:hypothetical protein